MRKPVSMQSWFSPWETVRYSWWSRFHIFKFVRFAVSCLMLKRNIGKTHEFHMRLPLFWPIYFAPTKIVRLRANFVLQISFVCLLPEFQLFFHLLFPLSSHSKTCVKHMNFKCDFLVCANPIRP